MALDNTKVSFEPLPEKYNEIERRQDAPAFKANTSFLPAIKPKVVKMTPFVRKRAIESEMAFLKELFRTASGDKWIRKKLWESGLDTFAGWDNITDVDVGKKGDPHYQRSIGELWMGENNLSGSLPPNFFWQGVPHLSIIELHHNKELGGPLPHLSSLRRLIVLDCRGCRLEGPLPTDMPPNLQRLLLSENRLEGKVWRWNLPKLKQLNLSHNKFTGAEVGAFSEMPDLELLDCQDNLIKQDYSTLFGRRLPEQIIHLNLSRNRLRGPLGTATAAAVHLEYISLADNQLTGTISETFGSIAKLRDLRLGKNKLTGELPRSITNLTNLRSLSLRQNSLQGPLDAIRWGNITQLCHLDLGQNPNLGGRLEAVPEDGAPRNWKYKKVKGMQWSDSDSDDRPEERLIKHEEDSEDDEELESLAVVQLKMKKQAAHEADLLDPNSKVSLKLRRIGELRELEFLDLSHCGLEGPLLKSICNLKKLRMLNLDGNKLTGPLPRLHWPKPGSECQEDLAGGLRALTKCTEIGLAHNRLKGSATSAVLSLPLGTVTARLNHNELEERRPRIRESHFGDSLAPAVDRLSGSLHTLLLHHNDLGRSPAGTGEKGLDSDESDDSDGEGGRISPRTKQAMVKARQRSILNYEFEDLHGRPINLTRVESDRAIVRQRYAVHHTKKYIDQLCTGNRTMVVELDPPNTEKLLLKGVTQARLVAPPGMLARLRFDWEQVLDGRAEDIPDYDDGVSGETAAGRALIKDKEPEKKERGRRKPKSYSYKSKRSMWDI